MATNAKGEQGKTYNTDVFGFVRRINRFIEEVFGSQSSGVSKTSPFDINRAKTYITALRGYHDWVIGQPELDLPETSSRAISLPANPVIPPIENESLYDLAVLLELARDELANSQSSRLSSNLISFDSLRMVAILDKVDAFIDSYILVIDPLDLPETSPKYPMAPGGSLGV
jgi:hypothetical protein